jgi:hypothetical protein
MFLTTFKIVSKIRASSWPTHGYLTNRSFSNFWMDLSIDASVSFFCWPIYGVGALLTLLFDDSLANGGLGSFFFSGSNIPSSSLIAVATRRGMFIFSNSESLAFLSASGESYQFFLSLG